MSSSSDRVLLLVDGYNVIGTWSSLKNTKDTHGLDSARLELVEILINYTALVGYQTEVVFDAHYQNSPAYSENHTGELSVYYTAFAETADTYIEKVCARCHHQAEVGHSRVIVATSDRTHQLTVLGYGASAISAQRLAGEVDVAMGKLRRKKRTSNKKSPDRFLFNSLDPKAQKVLEQWRKGKKGLSN